MQRALIALGLQVKFLWKISRQGATGAQRTPKVCFIQVMLGHASIKTTEIYTQVSIPKLKEIHTVMHPAERKENG